MISSRASGAVGTGRRAHTPIAAAISAMSARADAQASRRRDPAGACATRPSCCRPLLDVVDFDARVGDVVQPAVRILVQTPPQQLANRRRRVRRQRAPLGLAFENRRNRVRDGLARKRGASRQHLVQHAPERPDVGALVDGLTARLLRAHVGGRAEDRAACASSPWSWLAACDRSSAGAVARECAFARPKSSTLTVPSELSLMLAASGRGG